VNLVLCAIAAVLTAAASPSPIPVPSPSATVSATASATPLPSPSPIIPPRDAPPVRVTTPPFAPAHLTSMPKPPDSLWLGDATSIAVPMTIRAGRPYIEAILNGHSATLLVDTSAVGTLLDADRIDSAASVADVSLQIDQLRFPHLTAQAASVRAYTETNLGTAADMIVGEDLLSRYPVQLDFPDKTLTIYRDQQSAAAAMPKNAVAAAMRVIDDHPAIEASLDGDAGLWFSLATGMGGELLLEPDADHAAHLVREPSLPYEDITAAGSLFGRLVRAKTFTIGGVTFYQPLVGVVDSQRPGSELSGALGANILSRLDLFIDEPGSSMSFVAGPGTTSARLYDPSGLQLALRHNTIVVRSVVPGSPADAAHLHPNDEVLSINGLAPATLEFARTLLDGSPGTKVQVVYRRFGFTRSATLALRVLI
jgi:hypothetical protein